MILLIGYGFWGKNLARNFGSSLSAVYDLDYIRAEECKKLYPWIRAYEGEDNLEDILKNSDIKAVAIATRADTHFEIAKLCLSYNKDLWIEKPATTNLKDINELIKLQKQNIVFVDHTFCYHPAVLGMKEVNIGKPLYYDSTRISLGQFQTDVDVVLDLAIHDLSIIDFLYPELELDERHIIKHNHITTKSNQAIIDLKFKNKLPGSHRAFTAHIHANWVSPVKKRRIILTGSEKSVIYDDIDTDKLKIYDTGNIGTDYNQNQLGDINIPKINTTEALRNGYSHFADCIQKRVQPRTNLQRARKILSWVL